MRFLLFICGVLLGAPAMAGPASELNEITAGQPVTIRPDKAYLLIRFWRPQGVTSVEPVLLRVPRQTEMDAYLAAKREAFAQALPKLRERHAAAVAKKAAAEANGGRFKGEVPPEPALGNFDFAYDSTINVSNIHNGKAFVRGDPEATYLLEAPAGRYVIYGAAYGSPMMKDWLSVCFCLGTVGFDAKPGIITDLGTWYGDQAKKRSVIPELAAESGFGPSSDTPMVLLTGTVRPTQHGVSIPAALNRQPIVAADYHAVGKFVEPNAGGVNRLVPVPGVLAYDNGRVIDLKTARIVDDQ